MLKKGINDPNLVLIIELQNNRYEGRAIDKNTHKLIFGPAYIEDRKNAYSSKQLKLEDAMNAWEKIIYKSIENGSLTI